MKDLTIRTNFSLFVIKSLIIYIKCTSFYKLVKWDKNIIFVISRIRKLAKQSLNSVSWKSLLYTQESILKDNLWTVREEFRILWSLVTFT